MGEANSGTLSYVFTQGISWWFWKMGNYLLRNGSSHDLKSACKVKS